MLEEENRKNEKSSCTTTPIIVDGCSVTFTSTSKESDDSIKEVKEILLSAYKKKQEEKASELPLTAT